MFLVLLLLGNQTAPPPMDQLDRLAQARDVDGLQRYLAPPAPPMRSPFAVIKTNGAYDVGRAGWHALRLHGVGAADFVVFATPMTSEDTGELVFERVGDRLRYVPETEAFGIKLIRHDFDLKFDVPAKRATIVDKLRLSNVGGTPGTFMFRMSPQYLVSSIANRAGEAVPFAEAGGVVLTNKPQGEDTYNISYSAIVNQPNYAGSIGEKEATLTNDYWYPMVARQPVAYDLAIHGPRDWIAVGQGNLVRQETTAEERITRYKMDLPCVFYSVAAGPFKKFSQVINGRTYCCWSSQLNESQMEAQTEFYAPIIEFYSREYGPFPFKGYGAVDSAVYGGGALEAYSFTTWGHGSLPSEDCHEPSHTWWGGIIDNTYLTSFWNESFAVFSEGLYHRNVPIGNIEERAHAFVRDGNGANAYNSIPIVDGGASAGPVAGTLGYGKGSQVLQMLETLLGTERMVATMRAWVDKCRGTDVDWPDFEAVAEALNPGKELKSFFDDWLRKPGYAELRVSDVGFEGGKVELTAGFKGTSYRIPLEVMLQYADGKRSYSVIDLKKAGKVSIECAAKPVLVSVDPWRRILRRIEPNETPVEFDSVLPGLKRYIDPRHQDYLAGLGGDEELGAPSDPNGKFIVGHPDTMPILAGLCEKAGFKVEGDKLTYDGTTIDLNHGCAVAVVDLGDGKRCAIGLGKTRVTPDFGRAYLALTDDLGRFLRGKTNPKTSGNLTFRL